MQTGMNVNIPLFTSPSSLSTPFSWCLLLPISFYLPFPFPFSTYFTPSPLCSPITTCTTNLYLSRFSSVYAKKSIYFVHCLPSIYLISLWLIPYTPFNFVLIESLICSVHALHCSELYCFSFSASIKTLWMRPFTACGRNLYETGRTGRDEKVRIGERKAGLRTDGGMVRLGLVMALNRRYLLVLKPRPDCVSTRSAAVLH